MEELNNTELADENVNHDLLEETTVNELTNIESEICQDISSTAIIEYKEIEEPCVALTIIGENRLTNAEVFFKRGIKFSFKAFFSTLVLTIMNMFI